VHNLQRIDQQQQKDEIEGDVMNNIDLKKILIVFVVIFLMSRTRRIIEFFSNLNLDTEGIFTLEPLRTSSPGVRCLITAALFILLFVIIWKRFLEK
jgi:hypothetical protein